MAADQNSQKRRVITSFMLRFVHEAESLEKNSNELVAKLEKELPDSYSTRLPGPGWRGIVTHIQSGTEYHFTSLAEAENFIKRYIKE